MTGNRKYRILLLQLYPTELWFLSSGSNIPLAAGYLKAMALKEELLNDVDIEILNVKKRIGLMGNAALVEYIVSGSYDILGFTVYSFNSLQSIFIAEEAKKRIPEIKIIFGGPEITLNSKYILDNPVVDFGCFGEGEHTFVEILIKIIERKDDFENVKGIFYRKANKLFITTPRENTSDINQIPSPYISECISLETYKAAYIETSRGCALRCAYCTAHLRPPNFFSPDRIGNEIEYIIGKGVKYAFIIDSNFPRSPNFEKICQKIITINESKKISFFINACAEDIDERKADLLKKCNVFRAEIGLQSINPGTRKKINRPPFFKDKFLRGLRLLKERDITFLTGIIIGLPDETFQDFQSTYKFAIKNDISPIFHLLQVFPGIILWGQREKYGIKHLDLPPYLITHTRCFPKQDIEKAINLVNNKSRKQVVPISFIKNLNPRNSGHMGILRNNDQNIHLKHCINKVILPLETQDIDKLSTEGKMLANMVGQPFTAWFKKNSFDGNYFDLINAFILPIAGANPFIPINIVLETEKEFPLNKIEELKNIIHTKGILFSNSQKIIERFVTYLVFPWELNQSNRRLTTFAMKFPIYWALNITKQSNWQEKCADSLNDRNGWGIIIDFDPDIELNVIIEVLEFLCNRVIIPKKNICFTNLVIDSLFKSFRMKQESGKSPIVDPEFECILTYDENLNIASFLEPDPETKLKTFIWQKRIQKEMKRSIITSKLFRDYGE